MFTNEWVVETKLKNGDLFFVRLMLNNLEANHRTTLSTKMNIENLAMNRLKPDPKVAIGREKSESDI